MGNYNPHLPYILGEEWAPIRDETITYSPAVNAVELGHEFTLATTRQVRDARFYIHEFPVDPVIGQFMMAAIYPAGTEELSGPIRRVVLPVNIGAVTGADITNTTSVADALMDPSDLKSITFNASGDRVSCFFDFTQAPILNGKRILGLNLLYSSLGLDITSGGMGAFIETDSGAGLTAWGTLTGGPGIHTVRFGEINNFWSTTLSPASTADRMPWRYTDLIRFSNLSANRLRVMFRQSGATVPTVNIGYAALEVIFCDERRIAYGACAFNPEPTFLPNAAKYYLLGANSIPLRDLAHNADPIILAGNYTITLSSPDVGDLKYPTAGSAEQLPSIRLTPPALNGTRELYSIPPHSPVRVDLPFPPEGRIGEVFERVETHVVPQLSLHASGGTLTEPHVYGRQAVAQVWGSVTAVQEILDSGVGGAASWPYVRYYARRFGDTTVPLRLSSPTITGSNFIVDLTPGEWDALPEILDGWKEVSLGFPAPPSMGTGTSPQWRWSATGELVGNRWEVLGATAPALSGVPGNYFNLIPSPNQLSGATYGAPSSGAAINLTWLPQYAPTVTASSDDQTTDAVIIFGQGGPNVTGFEGETLVQELTGIGQDCGLDPCCVPTGLLYNQLTWSPPVLAGIGSDTFSATTVASWGNDDEGNPYTLTGTAADFSKNGEVGLITFSATSSTRLATLAIGPDADITVEMAVTELPTTGTLWLGTVLRMTNSANYLRARIVVATTGDITTFIIEAVVAGVATTLISIDPIQVAGAGGVNLMRFMVSGSFVKAKLWRKGDVEPAGWMLETTDTTVPAGPTASGVGVIGRDEDVTGKSVFFDNLVITPPGFWFGNYELQRMDSLTDWQTIMLSTNPGTVSFNDYEARVGLESTYRIRINDVYDFPGSWSSEVAITMASPGASGGCIEDGHVLLFTSNELQDGSVNLAYASVWEGRVEEDFTFTEASFVKLQAMYDRDFFVAFRPTERGGGTFSRTLLVQAAAIAPETLADFQSLRDMAWANVSYICVRDEDGNRWFATVLVPTGRVLRDRRLYMAPVTVIEVTDTPSEVDP